MYTNALERRGRFLMTTMKSHNKCHFCVGSISVQWFHLVSQVIWTFLLPTVLMFQKENWCPVFVSFNSNINVMI